MSRAPAKRDILSYKTQSEISENIQKTNDLPAAFAWPLPRRPGLEFARGPEENAPKRLLPTSTQRT
jgi:hypothetical protein